MGRPGIYAIPTKSFSLLDALALAGDTLPTDFEQTLHIVRREGDSQRVIDIPLKALREGKVALNLPIESGDIISVPLVQSGEFYVMGAVERPGVYSLTGRKISVQQGVASALGKPGDIQKLTVTVLRRTADDKEIRVLQDVPLHAIFDGTHADVYLEPNDIIRVTLPSPQTSGRVRDLLEARQSASAKVGLLEGKLTQCKIEYDTQQEVVKQLTKSVESGTYVLPEEVAKSVENDATLRSLQDTKLSLERDRAVVVEKRGEKSADVAEMDTRIRVVTEQYGKLLDREEAVAKLRQVETARAALATLEAQLGAIQRSYAEAQLELRDIEQALRDAGEAAAVPAAPPGASDVSGHVTVGTHSGNLRGTADDGRTFVGVTPATTQCASAGPTVLPGAGQPASAPATRAGAPYVGVWKDRSNPRWMEFKADGDYEETDGEGRLIKGGTWQPGEKKILFEITRSPGDSHAVGQKYTLTVQKIAGEELELTTAPGVDAAGRPLQWGLFRYERVTAKPATTQPAADLDALAVVLAKEAGGRWEQRAGLLATTLSHKGEAVPYVVIPYRVADAQAAKLKAGEAYHAAVLEKVAAGARRHARGRTKQRHRFYEQGAGRIGDHAG